MKYKKTIIITVVSIFVLYFLVNFAEQVLWWRAPLFSSINYAGIEKDAVTSKDPSKCAKLATNLGDSNPQQDCYWYSVIAINEVSFCDKYPVDAKFCRNTIASKKGDPSLCNAETSLNDYNYCIYGVAGGPAGPSICNLVKPGTNYSKDRCLLGIAEGKTTQQSSDMGVSDVKNVCNLISDSQLKDYCIGDIIIGSPNPTLCSLVKNSKNLNGTNAERTCYGTYTRTN